MILASFDFEITEPELRSLCECDETGTSVSNVVKAAIELGFDAYQAELVFEELKDLVSQNITPIVFVRVTESVNYSHAIVNYKLSKEKVFAIDPEMEEREINVNLFAQIWSRGLTIVIKGVK